MLYETFTMCPVLFLNMYACRGSILSLVQILFSFVFSRYGNVL